jgi:hypothetical protein
MLLQELRALRKDLYGCISSSDCACSPEFSAVCFPMTLLNMMASPLRPHFGTPPGIEPRLGFHTDNFLSFYTLKNLVHAGFDELIYPDLSTRLEIEHLKKKRGILALRTADRFATQRRTHQVLCNDGRW